MRYLRLTVRPTDREIHPVHTAMTERAFVDRVQMLHWNIVDVDVPAILFYIVGDAGRLADALESIPETEAFSITRIDDRRLYCYTQGRTTELERTLYDAFTRDGLVVLPPLTYRDDGGVRFEVVGEADALRTALATVPDGIDVAVERVGEYDTPRETVDAALTSRQRETVRTALAAGYYETPRRATIEDVAAELGCARSTAAEHLQKAESRIIRTVL
ncbi:helix-turn-helix domain-containing protein [Natrinema zhouii]|uniref:Helix-turn-helix domain-containing protein n=1 Tax=Natrinema zhouii TaxID=1710539 RepID=A0A7D6CPC8_9EURY|nr:helix-turn-helix domain-containing protein [Natrinema zhouii]QLK25714.1 helix-turn-helix domain-containing protein [Natrinema zhouii]